MKNFFQKNLLFPWLLPVFFVLHGFLENYDFILIKDGLLLLALYLLSMLILFFISYLAFKNKIKAALFSFLLMTYNFFFGSVQDTLRNLFQGSFIPKYAFIIPLSLCLLILAFLFLKRRKKPFSRLIYYLNLLFVLLIAMDAVWLTIKISASKNNKEQLDKSFFVCDNCNKPDVYVIIADEYAGNSELKDVFQFDNSSFTDQLSQRGFHIIPNSSSNYNYTPYSIASTLNMDYLDLNRTGKQPLLAYSYSTISNNNLLKFFQHHHYSFYNYSFFDFKGQPSYTKETFLPVRTKLITGQTLLGRLEKEIRYHLVTTLKWEKEIKKQVYYNRDNNQKLFDLTVQTAQKKSVEPGFVLTHLMMPHYPYYYDKNGTELPFDALTEGNQVNQHNYIEYLQYGNKKLLELVDQILKNSTTPPVIVLLGDHGFRHFTGNIDPKYYYNNLMAVYLPDKSYGAFTDNLTNVNLFRVVLNTSFKQRLPLLKDTAYMMENP